LHDVSFAYKKEDEVEQTLVLKNVNIKFAKNKISAVVGESGSGKSTIVQLLMRYYDPVSGDVTINDKNLK
jgi:ABC-type multidrug transport system fused ATPase/permease subunit